MRPFAFQPVLLPLVAIVAAAFATSDARASCGDYVVFARHGHASATKAQAQPHGAMAPICLPCQGPHCGKAPDVPASTSTTVVLLAESERLLVGASDFELGNGGGRFAASLDVAEHIQRVVKDIERPPQLN